MADYSNQSIQRQLFGSSNIKVTRDTVSSFVLQANDVAHPRHILVPANEKGPLGSTWKILAANKVYHDFLLLLGSFEFDPYNRIYIQGSHMV